MIKRELGIFLLVGLVTVLIDFVIYRGLNKYFDISIEIAKTMGFLVGTLFAYFANRFLTFGHRPQASGSALRFAMLYSITLAANVLINAIILAALNGSLAAVQLAFLMATATSAALNFFGMKLFVFKQNTAPGLS